MEAIAIGRGGEGSEEVISVSLLAGRHSDVADDSDARCGRGEAAQNERDSGPVSEPDVSRQDLRKVQNCRNEL